MINLSNEGGVVEYKRAMCHICTDLFLVKTDNTFKLEIHLYDKDPHRGLTLCNKCTRNILHYIGSEYNKKHDDKTDFGVFEEFFQLYKTDAEMLFEK